MTVKGDRVVAQWRCNGDTQVAAALRAVDAVTAIQSDASSVEVPEGWQRVSARVGVGVGELCVLRVGGAGDRAQQVTVGDALLQVSESFVEAVACSGVTYSHVTTTNRPPPHESTHLKATSWCQS
eukprot:34949-Eustigmatos_ZCMA.PRE.1